MDKIDIIKIKPSNIKALKKLGYNSKKYYVGPWGFMSILTQTRNLLEKHNIKFPFNAHAFKHDVLYNKGGSLLWKFKVDFKFLMDMLETINNKKSLSKIKKRLTIRALVFYIIVTLATPIYLKKGNWKTNGRK